MGRASYPNERGGTCAPSRGPGLGYPRGMRRLGLSALLLLVVPAVARAEPTICEITGVEPSAGTIELLCAPPESCITEGDCVESGFSDPVCGSSLADLPSICRPRCGTMIGCTGDIDCRPFRDIPGSCVTTTTTSGATYGLCAYRGLDVTYCTDAGGDTIEPSQVAHCHLRPGDGTLTSDYFEGDCDLDGCANGADPFPCVFSKDPVCGVLDTTVACSNATPDAGVPSLDAGPAARDAGVVPSFDAGPGVDANRVTGVSFGGGGGVVCTCRAHGRSAAPWALFLGIGLALVARRVARAHG